MVAIAHFIAISCYLGAAALAATPFARPVRAPVRGVLGVLAAGVLAHGFGLAFATRVPGTLPLTGLGQALSFAGLALAGMLLVVEALARDASLTLIAAPLAALAAVCANFIGMTPAIDASGVRGAWLIAHIALSFLGIAAHATAATAGAVYLVERRELKSRRFGPIFRLFPPLDTLDRLNHRAAVGGWVGLTLGIALAVTYAITYHTYDTPKIVWATGAWLAVTLLAFGRLLGGWQARRAARLSSASFVAVVLLYVAFRVAGVHRGTFL
jgi:ABC-type uncharacterized transport system permease subunit